MSERINRIVRGWKPSPPKLSDANMRNAGLILTNIKDYPANYDDRETWFPTYDQLDVGDCVLNSVTGAVMRYLQKSAYKWFFMPSRLFGYYNARVLIDGGDATDDSGTSNRSGIEAVAKYGLCPEAGVNANPAWSWAYGDAESKRFTLKPNDACYKDAVLHCALQYQSVLQHPDVLKMLLSQGIPIVIGFTVYSSFMTQEVADTGIMPVPRWFESVEGGHSVLAVGYLSNYPAGKDGVTDWIICRNSWGENWGQKGYFLAPLKCVTNVNQFSDFWAITGVGFKPAQSMGNVDLHSSRVWEDSTVYQHLVNKLNPISAGVDAAAIAADFVEISKTPQGQKLIADILKLFSDLKTPAV